MLPSRLDVFPCYARVPGYALFPVYPLRTISLFTRLATIAWLPGNHVSPGYAKQQRSRPARLTRITRLPGKHKLPSYPATTNFDEIAPCETPDPRCCELPGAKSQVPDILVPGLRCHIPQVQILRCQILMCQIQGGRYQMPDPRCQTPGTRFQVPEPRCQICAHGVSEAALDTFRSHSISKRKRPIHSYLGIAWKCYDPIFEILEPIENEWVFFEKCVHQYWRTLKFIGTSCQCFVIIRICWNAMGQYREHFDLSSPTPQRDLSQNVS